MKNTKMRRMLLLAACALLLVTLSVGATMAYLTSTTNTVRNTFTVGKVEIELDEAKVTALGVQDGDSRVQANTYKLLPGRTYLKDPTVHVGDESENCWLFVKVVNEIAAIEGATTIADQMTANGWTAVAGTENVYAYEAAASAGADVVVFESFTVAAEATEADLEGCDEKAVTIIAYAVQADNFTTAAAAWAAAPATW